MNVSFSAAPGCRERHLRRKHHNPLFPDAERHISAQQLHDARQLDQADEKQFRDAFQALLGDVGSLSGHVETEAILDIKERIDRLYEQCAGLGGDLGNEKQALRRLNDVIMGAVRKAAGDDPLAAEELEKEASARETHLGLLEFALVADLLRADSPIERDDLVPTLLSEDADTVRVVMSLFDAPQQDELRQEAHSLLQRLQSQGDATASMAAALAAMKPALQ